jgi:hypothetical protein
LRGDLSLRSNDLDSGVFKSASWQCHRDWHVQRDAEIIMSDGMADWKVISKQTDRSRSFSLREVLLSLLLLDVFYTTRPLKSTLR